MTAQLGQSVRRIRHLARVGVPALARRCRGRWLRRRHAAALASLPPLATPPGRPSLEVHMLSGHAQADMGMRASWSVMRFLPDARLCVHSDGTLTGSDRAAWARLVPGTRFVDRTEADVQCADLLPAACSRLRQWRDVHVLSSKLVDAHLLAETDHVLVMDTDVLCFHPPTAVRQCVTENSSSAWMRDMHHAYVHVPQVLHEVLGAPVPMHVNSGFWIAPRAGKADFELMEWALDRWWADGRCDWAHMWAEQTMTAIWLGRLSEAAPLPAEYAVVPGPTPTEQVVHHYVGTRTVRPRFFTEGVPRVRRQVATRRLDGRSRARV